MLEIWLLCAVAVTAGFAATALRGAIYQLARPVATRGQGCPHCAQPPIGRLASWQGHCRCCRRRIGPPPGVVELLSAAVAVLIVGALGLSFAAAAFAAVAVLGVAMAAIDLASLRLPDVLTGVASGVLVLGLTLQSATTGDWARFGASLLAGPALLLAFLLLALVKPGQVGLGDVKLAGLLGIALGWFGWVFVVLGGCLAFLLCALAIVVLLATRRITRHSQIPFGPFMLLGAACALML